MNYVHISARSVWVHPVVRGSKGCAQYMTSSRATCWSEGIQASGVKVTSSNLHKKHLKLQPRKVHCCSSALPILSSNTQSWMKTAASSVLPLMSRTTSEFFRAYMRKCSSWWSQFKMVSFISGTHHSVSSKVDNNSLFALHPVEPEIEVIVCDKKISFRRIGHISPTHSSSLLKV